MVFVCSSLRRNISITKNLNEMPQKTSTDKNGGDCYHLQNIKKCKKRVIKTDVELIE